MIQRIIRSLRDNDLVAPLRLILGLLLILSLIIVLGQFFHQSLQEEMANQFNQQQLLLAREVAMNIESYVDHVFKSLRAVSQFGNIEHIDRDANVRSAVEAITFNLQNEALVTIRVVDRNGIVRYDSAYPGRERGDLSRTDYFEKIRLLPRSEKLVTDLLDIHTSPPESKEFIVATPVYHTGREASPEFRGAVIAVLSLEGMTRKFISPIKSGSRGYAWMMDSEGSLLYHPTQPGMVGKNLYRTDANCFQCHRSFATEKKMIESETEIFGSYDAPGGENKLAAYARIPIARKSWIVVVSAPYSDVIALMRKSMRFYSLLIISIFITTLAASAAVIVNYKNKIKADEKAKHLENQRRLEQEIEHQKNYLESIVENTRTNIMVLDRNLHVLTMNSSQAKTLGCTREESLGKPIADLFPDGLEPYEGIPFKAILNNTLAGRSFELRDYRVKNNGDSPLYLTMNLSPLLIDGKTPGVLITSNDVSRRVQLEEALKQYAVELEDKVDRGTATAKQLEQQIMHSEKLAALGRLAAGVAHEIGNPLTSISTFSQLLREMATDEFSQNSLDVINNHIQRITDIVRRMSTFARADAVNIRHVQVNDVVNNTLDLMRIDKRMKSTISIAVTLATDLPEIMIDEGQLSQVLINIMLNALDAMPDGGVLSVASRRERNESGACVVCVCIADTGVGIPQEDLNKIFDPFYTTKEPGKGTGLGLSISYDIIKRFGGNIFVQSQPGKGTTFTLHLPTEQPA